MLFIGSQLFVSANRVPTREASLLVYDPLAVQRNFRSVFRLRRVLRALATAWPIEVCANTHSQALGSPELFCGPVVCSLRLVHFKKITIASLGHLSRSYGCKKNESLWPAINWD